MQEILVILSISAAVGYLVYLAYKRVNKKTSCEGCALGKSQHSTDLK